MKTCSKCKKDKNLTDFNKNKTRKDGLNTFCRDCGKEISRQYYNNNTDYHKSYIVKQNKRRRKEVREKLIEYKSLHSCKYCPENEPCCLDFHHLRDKVGDISRMIGTGCKWETILEEIEKCELVCANCHRKLHSGLLP